MDSSALILLIMQWNEVDYKPQWGFCKKLLMYALQTPEEEETVFVLPEKARRLRKPKILKNNPQ
jgi:hypothetical protein